MTPPTCACVSGSPYAGNPGARYGDSPTVMRRVAFAGHRDTYAICNECGRRWLLRTIGGYPQDEDTIREDVTGNAEADELFAMDRTTELSLAAQRGDREAAGRFSAHRGASRPIQEGSGTSREVSRTILEGSVTVRKVPGRSGRVPGRSWKVPGRSGRVPPRSGNLPG